MDSQSDGSSSGGGGGGQSRTIYSQRHLSPHRMMHFGKRPMSELPPTINARQGYFEVMPAAARPALVQQPPFLFAIEFDGQTLKAFPEGKQTTKSRLLQFFPEQQQLANPFHSLFSVGISANTNSSIVIELPCSHTDTIAQAALNNQQQQQLLPMDRNLWYTLPAATQLQQNNNNQLTFGAGDEEAKSRQQLVRQLIGQRQQESGLLSSGGSQRLSKLVDNDESKSSNDEVNSERTEDSANGQQLQPNSISISTRSMHSPGRQATTLSLPKAFVSTLFHGGRQGSPSSMPSFGAYNKKAEPKENFFMHFGRK